MKSQMTAREWLGTLILLAFLAYLLLTQTGCASVKVSGTVSPQLVCISIFIGAMAVSVIGALTAYGLIAHLKEWDR